MRLRRLRFIVWAAALAAAGAAQTAGVGLQPAPVTAFVGARVITGRAGAPIETGTLLVERGRITRVGRSAEVQPPRGSTIVDLRGKTVMPAIVDGHSHLGYTNAATGNTAAAEYTRDNIVDQLRRYAYFGIAATLSLGLDRGDLPYRLRAEPVPGAARFLTAGRGIAWPNAGPRADYWKDAAYGVTTEAEARGAVRELASRKVDIVKVWVDDRDRSVTPLPPALYRAAIDEAHRHRLRVVAHVYYLADAKELLRAGVDGFAHGIRDRDVDDELMALLRERRRVFVIPNLPDTPPSTADLAWLADTLPPAQIASLERTAVADPPRPPLFTVQARNLARMAAAGVRIGFGTDAGVGAPYGWSAHAEMADMVAAGMTPAQVLVAATSTTADIAGLADLGVLEPGRSADFIVLEANPLVDIRHTRRITQVYLRGAAVDREGLGAAWTRNAR